MHAAICGLHTCCHRKHWRSWMLLIYTGGQYILGAMGGLVFRHSVYQRSGTGLLHTNPARPAEHTVKKAVAARSLCLIVLAPCEKPTLQNLCFQRNISARILLVGKCVVPSQHVNSVSSPVLVCVAAEHYKCNSDQLSLAHRKLAHLSVYLNELRSEMVSIRYLWRVCENIKCNKFWGYTNKEKNKNKESDQRTRKYYNYIQDNYFIYFILWGTNNKNAEHSFMSD